jgi:hypothetical protein
LYLDVSDVGLNDSSDEDVAGVSIDAVTGDIYLSTRGAFSVPDVSGGPADVLVCQPESLGSATSCNFTSHWVGSAHGLTSDNLLGIQHGEGSAQANQ